MQTVAETAIFTRQAGKLFSDDEKKAVIDVLASYPLSGDIIPHTGGVRKIRVPSSGRGKRGGARVIYYYFSEVAPLYALLVYPKNKAANLTQDEAKMVKSFADAIKAHYRRMT